MIDEVRKNPAAKLVYFFCHHSDEQRDNFAAMTRSFLHQLCHMDQAIVSYLYETAVSDGGACLATRKSAEKLLAICLKRVAPVHIVFDGVDECKESEQKAIIPWLRKFVDDSAADPQHSRCLFLSQYDGSTKALLSNVPGIPVTAKDNRADIDVYCGDWAESIRAKLNISHVESTQLAVKTSERAQGQELHPWTKPLQCTDVGYYRNVFVRETCHEQSI